jgi:hypothetical protein
MIFTNVAIKENLTHQTWLTELKNIASAAGWAVIDYQLDKTWADTGGGYYDWVSGGIVNFTALESVGYGAQTLHYRLMTQIDGADPQSDYLQIGSQKFAHKAIDHYNSTYPHRQNNWNTYYEQSLPAAIERAWFFATSTFIISCVQASSTYIYPVCFGSPEVFSATETEAMWLGYCFNSHYYRWYDNYFITPFDQVNRNLFYNDNYVPITEYSFRNDGNPDWENGAFTKGYAKILEAPAPVGIARPMQKQIIYTPLPSTNYRAVGTLPVYRFYFPDDWAKGIKKTYGTREYYVFSGLKYPRAGYAIRIV